MTPELAVQGKARLGQVVHKKTATALALTVVKNEDQREFAKLVESVKQTYNDGPRVSWGGGIMGPKSQVRGLGISTARWQGLTAHCSLPGTLLQKHVR